MTGMAVTTAQVDWYFDFISPYSYLAFELLPATLAGIDPPPSLHYRPVLFAGLLNHWGQLGPAEIAPKRRFTYEQVLWLADRHGIAMRLPRQHPFNPLPLLRAAIAADCRHDVIARLFRFVWRDGALPDEPGFATVLAELGIDAARLDSTEVKAALRANGEAAVAQGVFGVPSAVAQTSQGVRTIWGVDAAPMLADWLRGAPVFDTVEMQRAANLPTGAQRPGAAR